MAASDKPERRDDTAGVIAPPPLIAAATVVFGLLMDWLFPVYVLTVLLIRPTRIAIGVILMLTGAAVGIAAVRTFRRIGTNVEPWKPTTRLVMTGIYTRLRNPMYVGFGLFIAGLAIALASDWMLVFLIPASLLLHYGVVLREERYLEAKFSDAYRRYKASVPRYGWPL